MHIIYYIYIYIIAYIYKYIWCAYAYAAQDRQQTSAEDVWNLPTPIWKNHCQPVPRAFGEKLRSSRVAVPYVEYTRPREPLDPPHDQVNNEPMPEMNAPEKLVPSKERGKIE